MVLLFIDQRFRYPGATLGAEDMALPQLAVAVRTSDLQTNLQMLNGHCALL